MTRAPEILLVDDDEAFCTNLHSYFAAHGLPVSVITDPTVAAAIDFQRFRLVLLDLDMPYVSGLDIVARLPKLQRPLVIVVSGHSDIETRLALLDKGADFFIPKPVELHELWLIARRVISRAAAAVDAGPLWILDRNQHMLETPGGERFGLSSSEFRVIERLIRNAPEVTAKDQLAEALTGRPDAVGPGFTRTLEVMISRMRMRFGSESEPFPVKALRNAGYVFHGHGAILE